MKRLIIGSVTALWTPDEPKVTPDDRQELVKTFTLSGGAYVPSVVVVDAGRTDDGEVKAYSGVKFTSTDWATVQGYAKTRTMVTVVGTDGVSGLGRIVDKGSIENKHFNSVTADIEIWRI